MHRDKIRGVRADMIVRQWARGVLGFARGLLQDWKGVAESFRRNHRRAQAVKSSIYRFLLGDKKGIMDGSFQAWKKFHENAQLKKKLARKNAEQTFKLFAFTNSGTTVGLVFAEWRKDHEEILEKREQELHDKLIREQKRRWEAEVSKQHLLMTKAASCLGMQHERCLMMEAFFEWARVHQNGSLESKYKQALKELASTALLGRCHKDDAAQKKTILDQWKDELQRSKKERLDWTNMEERHQGEYDTWFDDVTNLENQIQISSKMLTSLKTALGVFVTVELDLNDVMSQKQPGSSPCSPKSALPRVSRRSSPSRT